MIRWKRFWVALACALLVILVGGLSACETVTPYYEVGVGAALESGDYHARIGAPEDQSIFFVELDERCAIGWLAFGVELEHGIDVGFQHSSCFNHSPEISNNQFLIKKRGYFK